MRKLPFLLMYLIMGWMFKCTSVEARNVDLDSLKTTYPALHDTLKLESIRRIIIEHMSENDSALKYAQIGLDHSRAFNHINYEAKFLMYLSMLEKNRGNAHLSIRYGKEAIRKFDHAGNVLWAAGMCNTCLLYTSPSPRDS